MATLNQFVLIPLWNEFFSPLWSDMSYFRGFVFGLVLSFVVGSVSRQLVWLRGLVLKFFAPTKEPATAQGPRPSETAVGCLRGLLGLAAWVVFFLLLLTVVVHGFLHTGP
jgi:hypothetical protein